MEHSFVYINIATAKVCNFYIDAIVSFLDSKCANFTENIAKQILLLYKITVKHKLS